MTDEKSEFFNSDNPIYLERIDSTLTVFHSKPCKREELFRFAEKASKAEKEDVQVNHNGQTLFRDGKALISWEQHNP